MAKKDFSSSGNLKFLLVDDDQADCTLFKEASEGLPAVSHFKIIHDGETRMNRPHERSSTLPQGSFMNIHLLRKNSFISPGESKFNACLQNLPLVIVFVLSKRQWRDIKVWSLMMLSNNISSNQVAPRTSKKAIQPVPCPITFNRISLPSTK